MISLADSVKKLQKAITEDSSIPQIFRHIVLWNISVQNLHQMKPRQRQVKRLRAEENMQAVDELVLYTNPKRPATRFNLANQQGLLLYG